MSKWQKLGLNVFEEWIEENDKGQRRVSTTAGYIPEPEKKNIRWGRVTSSSDASMVSQSLSYRHIFESFQSLSKASIVYTGKKDASFILLVKKHMSKRIWLSAVYKKWTSSLPSWDLVIYKNGLNNWPLFIDIGLWKFLNLNKMTLEDFLAWQNSNKNKFSVNDKKPSTPSLEIYDHINDKKWWICIPDKVSENKVITALKWHGEKPDFNQKENISSSYIPFSSLDGLVTGYADPVLNYAQSKSRPNINPLKAVEIVANELGATKDELISFLSYDQIDAVFLIIQKMNSSGSFLLADETGYGKGRVLSSISKIAINKGYQVLFFTERQNLFTDFYRDLLAVDTKNSMPIPFLLHNSASITSPDGKKIKTQNKGDYTAFKWIWTTYSQFNRDNKEKLSSLCDWMRQNKTILIMDEAQNAAGQSNTAKSIKKIQSFSSSVIFSSATFAKNEEQLSAYRSLFDGKNWEWERLKHAFKSNNEVLRSAITLLWASQGSYLRREHPPMSLPEPKWMVTDNQIKSNENIFSSWWDKALELSSQWSLIQNGYDSSWAKIGSMLFRASREFSILQKQDFLLEQIKESISQNQKAVIVSDWILSSHVQRLVDNKKQEVLNGDDFEENIKIKKDLMFKEKPSWKESWVSIFNDSFPLDNFSLNNPSVKKFKKTQDELNEIIRSLPDWSISPFDDLMEKLGKLNISFLEISGRTWRLLKEGDEYKITNAPKKDRNLIISSFNNEKIDCIFLTRAGNSGASLHSGINFKDQKQRHMIEWDVSPDPSVRLQFWGRVRRKDQVNEPQRSTILLDTNFERRRYNRDNIKQEKLLSHSGTSKNNQYPDYLGNDGNFIARNWLLLNPECRKKAKQFQDVDVGQLMSRSIVFNEKSRNSLMENLDSGIELLSDWYVEKENVFQRPSRSIRKKWWWGTGESSLYWSERLWDSRQKISKEEVLKELSEHSNGKSLSAKKAFDVWSKVWVDKYASSPNTITAYHENLMKWWKQNHHLFERGMGISIIDPLTKERVNAIVLGWSLPDKLTFENTNQNQISVHVWACTMQRPIALSLASLVSKDYAFAKSYNRQASPSWFDNQSCPTRALVLLGPSWSVASWGARANPVGELIYLEDEFEGYQWGWKMPSSWLWSDMLSTNRELASIAHAREFIKDFSAPVFWQLSSLVTIKSQPQSDGMFVTGNVKSYEGLPFNLLKRCGPVKWDSNRENWSLIIAWSNVSYAFNQWISLGFIPTIEAKYLNWYTKTWPIFAPKK